MKKIFKNKLFVALWVQLLLIVLTVVVTEYISCVPAYIVAISAIFLIWIVVYGHTLH